MKEYYIERVFIMKLAKGDKVISIPGWAVFIGLIVVNNMVSNICKTVTNNNILKYGDEK